jgi:hypothetical protein
MDRQCLKTARGGEGGDRVLYIDENFIFLSSIGFDLNLSTLAVKPRGVQYAINSRGSGGGYKGKPRFPFKTPSGVWRFQNPSGLKAKKESAPVSVSEALSRFKPVGVRHSGARVALQRCSILRKWRYEANK